MDWEFSYDLIGRTTGIYASDGRYVGYTYDSFNRIKETTEYVGGMTLRTGYRYDDQSNHSYKTGLFRGIFLNNIRQLAYSYDDMGRRDKRVLMTATPFVTEYTYHNGAAAGTTSTVVKTVKNGNTTWEYAYDALGNIESIKKNGTLVERYTYDSLSQLKSVVRGSDTYAYSYDAGGNLLSVTKNGTVVQSYTYGNTAWKDLLTAYNGQTITYDAIGNPLTYRDGFSFTWSNVRQLTTATQGSNTYTYTYDASGLRTSKTVNGTRTDYYWLGDTLQAQKTGDEYLIFLYDENGTPYGFIQKNGSSETYYYYIFNLQGDVIGILNASGTEVVTYTYDAWGNPLSITGTLASTIGAANPLRYRGYYFDSETGFYYLQSRYYDPTTGRFINADSASNLAANSDFASYNLFAYCGNNPVSRQDSSGDAWETVWDIVSLSASVLEVVANPTDPWAWAGLVGDVIDVALPCVGGLGEAVDAAKTTVRVIQGVDDVVDTAKTFRHAADAVDDVRHATGAYVVLYESGQHYIGKGGFSRAITSAIGHMSDTNKVSAIVWAPASSSKSAFVTEFLLQTVYGAGKDVAENFNKIWSPGKKLFQALQ